MRRYGKFASWYYWENKILNRKLLHKLYNLFVVKHKWRLVIDINFKKSKDDFELANSSNLESAGGLHRKCGRQEQLKLQLKLDNVE